MDHYMPLPICRSSLEYFKYKTVKQTTWRHACECERIDREFVQQQKHPQRLRCFHTCSLHDLQDFRLAVQRPSVDNTLDNVIEMAFQRPMNAPRHQTSVTPSLQLRTSATDCPHLRTLHTRVLFFVVASIQAVSRCFHDRVIRRWWCRPTAVEITALFGFDVHNVRLVAETQVTNYIKLNEPHFGQFYNR